MTHKIRLHLLAVPHTITRDEYSHDAFTGKVKRFSPMMRSRGFEVFHYGIETSESGANKDIEILTKAEWSKLRIESLMFLEPTLSYEEAVKKNDDSTLIPNHLSNWSTPLSIKFNEILRNKLKENYRNTQTDIVCIPLSRMHENAIKNCNYVTIETGIGYSGSHLNYRIFESYSWLSHTLAIDKKPPNNYWFVVPNFFNINDFKLSLNPNSLRVGFLGRIETCKGINIIVELAKHFPNVEFVLCGGGNPESFLKYSNIIYKPPIHGKERSDYLGDCIAVLCPSIYLEPFCGVSVEAQLCGTPVICSDSGGMVETVKQFKSGLRCHTLADYCYGIQYALDNKFDRQYIRERAVKLFDMYNLAHNYEYIFKSVLDIHTPGKNGWYSPDQHISIMNSNVESIPKKIWQTWTTHDMPVKMTECVNKLKLAHPDFEYKLFNEDECYLFIKEHFPIEVSYAFKSLIPKAYKADLWRLCILYIYGGIYLDIKLQFVNCDLNHFIDKEYFVCDGKSSIYNSFLICKKNNIVLLKSILQIVYNVSIEYYGTTPYSITGPLLIGKIHESYNNTRLQLIHYGPKSNETIRMLNDDVVCDNYKEYREEQKESMTTSYDIAWSTKKIYNETQKKLSQINTQNIWSDPFNELLKCANCSIDKLLTPRIYIFLPYFGEFPNYFQLYLNSLKINNDILSVFLITDIDMSSYELPNNLIIINMSIQSIRQRASTFILKTYKKVVPVDQLILNNYKLVDFKIIFSLLFDDILIKYNVSKNDYVGWGDCDLIYGKLSTFIKFENPFEIIGGWHGHFTAIKNTESFKNLFLKIPNYFDLIIDNSHVATDEIAYREPLINYLKDNNFKMFYTNAYFCDIVPPCFFTRFRPTYMEYKKNFFDVYHPLKNINHLIFDTKLMVKYDEDDDYTEVLYCHLQKRKMKQLFNSYDTTFYINEDSFTNSCINNNENIKIS